MIDIRLIREDAAGIEKKLQKKDKSVKLDSIVELDNKIRNLTIEVDELKNIRNTASKEIGALKDDKAEQQKKIDEVQEISEKIKSMDPGIKELKEELKVKMLGLPNAPHDSVPVSDDEEDKIITRAHGEQPKFDFEFKNHVEIGVDLDIFDMERGAKVSQSNFPIYKGDGARLEWALINYMRDFLVYERNFVLIIPPFLVNEESMYTSGNLPKFGDQAYRCKDDELYMIPTSEVPMTSMHRDEILSEEDLPIEYCAYSACFRREAGAYGKGERGLIRVHQFNKVEMFKFVKPEDSYEELENLVANAEELVKGLGLHYRTALLVTTDIAQQSAKTYDIEVWLPGQDKYYEVSSCSNCEDFQARRGNIRYRPKDSKKTQFVHTLNGSGLATSRLMVSLIESNQQKDGSVVIPEVLRPYMRGQEIITKK